MKRGELRNFDDDYGEHAHCYPGSIDKVSVRVFVSRFGPPDAYIPMVYDESYEPRHRKVEPWQYDMEQMVGDGWGM